MLKMIFEVPNLDYLNTICKKKLNLIYQYMKRKIMSVLKPEKSYK